MGNKMISSMDGRPPIDGQQNDKRMTASLSSKVAWNSRKKTCR